MENSENVRGTPYYLGREELWRLTQTWASWADSASSTSRIIARARLHFYFLLSRFGGMRSNEISNFRTHACLDMQTGLLQLKNRKLFLPPAAMRPIRHILSFKETEENSFFYIDPGFLRKTFYGIGILAGVPPESCAPRALRYARGLEMLELHISPQVIADSLGLASPVPLIRLLEQRGKKSSLPNHFPAIINEVETDFRAARLILKIAHGILLTGIYPLQELTSIEPKKGKPLNIFIPPGLIFPSDVQLPMTNHLCGQLLSLKRDSIEIRMTFRATQLELLSCQDNLSLDVSNFEAGAKTHLYIPAHAIKLDNSN